MATTLILEREAAQISLVWLTALVTVLVCCRSVAGNPANVTNVKCTSAADCSLGGVCKCEPQGVHTCECVCDPWWSGPSCTALNLAPASKVIGTQLWDRGNDTASWGGNVVYDEADSKYHLFFAEFMNHCPLGSWGTNSVVSHAVSDSPAGPYKKKETVLPPFHHNPTIAYDPVSKTFLLVSIGNGSSTPKQCNATMIGPSDSPPQQPEANLGDPAAAGIITLWHSSSANGPWTLQDAPVLSGRPGKWDAFVTNPSLYIFPNGTVLMAYRGGWSPWHVGIAVAPTWRGPFVRVSDKPVFEDIQEDPGLFRDPRGNFHILTHDFAEPTGGHAYSANGIDWTFAGQAYGKGMQYTDGSSVEFTRRERPQVLILNGKPALLFNGVQPAQGLSYTQMQPLVQA